MPVRSLTSSVLTWPNAKTVDDAVRHWAGREAKRHDGVVRIGYFGSYARGDWGPGSDLDLVVVVAAADTPFVRRAVAWDTSSLPVASQLLVYTRDEWAMIRQRGDRFARALDAETVWVYEASSPTDQV
jgi:predicted nucleotidyltransferase